MKLINLCEYTMNQSLYDEGVYPPFRTAAEIMDAQDFINDLNENQEVNQKWVI